MYFVSVSGVIQCTGCVPVLVLERGPDAMMDVNIPEAGQCNITDRLHLKQLQHTVRHPMEPLKVAILDRNRPLQSRLGKQHADAVICSSANSSTPTASRLESSRDVSSTYAVEVHA